MYHKQNFPTIFYNSYRVVDNTVRVVLNNYVKKNINYFFDYTVKDFQRPETVAYDFYGSVKLGWIILIANDIQDPFHDWVMDTETFNKYLSAKYLGDTIEPHEYHHYEDENGTEIPEPSSDNLRSKYGITNLDYELFKAHSYEKDGKRIPEPSSSELRDLYKVSFYDYEVRRNDKNRQIKIPLPEFIDQIETELSELLSM